MRFFVSDKEWDDRYEEGHDDGFAFARRADAVRAEVMGEPDRYLQGVEDGRMYEREELQDTERNGYGYTHQWSSRVRGSRLYCVHCKAYFDQRAPIPECSKRLAGRGEEQNPSGSQPSGSAGDRRCVGGQKHRWSSTRDGDAKCLACGTIYSQRLNGYCRHLVKEGLPCASCGTDLSVHPRQGTAPVRDSELSDEPKRDKAPTDDAPGWGYPPSEEVAGGETKGRDVAPGCRQSDPRDADAPRMDLEARLKAIESRLRDAERQIGRQMENRA